MKQKYEKNIIDRVSHERRAKNAHGPSRPKVISAVLDSVVALVVTGAGINNDEELRKHVRHEIWENLKRSIESR